MRDNLRRSHAIHTALTQAYPAPPTGPLARPLNPLAALLSGIVGSKSTQLPPLAAQGPNGTKPASRVTRLARCCANDHVLEEGSFFPSAAILLRHGALQTLGLVLEGRVAGRGGKALMLPGVSKGRALPLAWRVRQGPQGHLPADPPIALVALVSGRIPEGTQGVFLGEGAGDGTRRQHTGEGAGWAYVCRTGCHRTAWWDGETLRRDTLGAWSKPGTLVALSAVWFTREEYGPRMRICCGAKGGQEPLSLVTHMDAAEEACRVDSKRCRLETFCSDQKSRGFPLHQSPLADPQRLSRLFIAAC